MTMEGGGKILANVRLANGLLQQPYYTVSDRATLLLSATGPLDRNNHEPELKKLKQGWLQLLQNEQQLCSTTTNAMQTMSLG